LLSETFGPLCAYAATVGNASVNILYRVGQKNCTRFSLQ